MRSSVQRLGSLGLCPVLLLSGAAARAAGQWYFEPSITLTALYNDNIALTTRDKESSPGIITAVGAKAGRRTKVLEMGVDAKVSRRDYFQAPDRDSTDFSLSAKAARSTRKDNMTLDVSLERDSTTTSELTTSGLTNAQKRRVKWLVAPSWRHQLTPRWGLTANASYQDVSYRDAEFTGLTDYTYTTLGLDTDYAFDQRIRVLGQVNFSRYKTDRTDITSDTTGVLGGVGYSFSPKWSVRGLLGLRRSETTIPTAAGTTTSSGTGYLADILATRQFQTAKLTLGLNKSLNPSGNGELLDSQRFSLDWNQNLSERWQWRVLGNRYLNERSTRATGTNNRVYWAITPSLRYKLDREWSLLASYRYRYQKYENNTDAATSNAVLMVLSYRPLTRK